MKTYAALGLRVGKGGSRTPVFKRVPMPGRWSWVLNVVDAVEEY